MNIEQRNEILCRAYESGESMTSISKRTGISCSQLSRIFRAKNIQRTKFELDKSFFESNKDKSYRQISEESGLPLKRVMHLYRVAYGKPLTKGKTDFTDNEPSVDINLINDKSWLYEQYIIKKLGTPSIAKMLASKTSTVIKKLKEHKIPLRNISQASKMLEKRPDKDWLIKHYVDLQWSITKCAKSYKTGFDAIYSALIENGIKARSASEQHIGELNEFFGLEHDAETVAYCAEIGAKYGKLYWLEGDVQSKIDLASQIAKTVWSDINKRAIQSAKIAELCVKGGCNSKQILYIRERDQKAFIFRSSWEYATALCLEDNPLVNEWEFESLSIPYTYDGVLKNYIIDFKVDWKNGITTYVECKNQHLLKSAKELAKIEAATKFLRDNKSNLVVIEKLSDLKEDRVEYTKLEGTRYSCDRSYLKKSAWSKEVLIHELIERVCPWDGLRYSDEELALDFARLKSENIDLYKYKNEYRSTVPTKFGMPGRAMILHFQQHFFNVVINNNKTLIDAFEDKWVIYRSILRSMEENESLSLERLLREINFHFTNYGRTSHFAAGFARAIIREMGMSGKRMFDPCCGWGGRLLGAYLENCDYAGAEISPLTCAGLDKIGNYIGYQGSIKNSDCLDMDWNADFILTSPPFYDVEEYIGGEQPHKIHKSRDEWSEGFVIPFINKIGNIPAALYLDKRTLDDFHQIKPFDKILLVSNKRHARRKEGYEYWCFYNV